MNKKVFLLGVVLLSNNSTALGMMGYNPLSWLLNQVKNLAITATPQDDASDKNNSAVMYKDTDKHPVAHYWICTLRACETTATKLTQENLDLNKVTKTDIKRKKKRIAYLRKNLIFPPCEAALRFLPCDRKARDIKKGLKVIMLHDTKRTKILDDASQLQADLVKDFPGDFKAKDFQCS